MQAMERALFRRMEHMSDVIPHPYKLNKPQIHYFGDKFTDSKSSAEARNPNSKIIPCATSKYLIIKIMVFNVYLLWGAYFESCKFLCF